MAKNLSTVAYKAVAYKNHQNLSTVAHKGVAYKNLQNFSQVAYKAISYKKPSKMSVQLLIKHLSIKPSKSQYSFL